MLIKILLYYHWFFFVRAEVQKKLSNYEQYQDIINEIKLKCGGDLIAASVDIVSGYPTNKVVIGYDRHLGVDFHFVLIRKFMSKDVSVISFNLSIIEEQEKYFQFLSTQVKNYLETYTLFFCNSKFYEHILLEIYDRNLMRRNMIYFFYWGNQYPGKFFLRNLHEAMKIIVIWNPKNGTSAILMYNPHGNRSQSIQKHYDYYEKCQHYWNMKK